METTSRIAEIAELARKDFEARTLARDAALTKARSLTRFSAHAIRAIHRSESALAEENLNNGRAIFNELQNELADYPDLYLSGYTQDAIKEFCEATLTCAIIEKREIPTPTDMGVIYSTYLRGMAETPGELRRRCMDILRMGYSEEAERLLSQMDEIYSILVTMDYPDGVTNGLRRQTDLLRGIVERTRADLTLSLQEEKLKSLLQEAITTYRKE